MPLIVTYHPATLILPVMKACIAAAISNSKNTLRKVSASIFKVVFGVASAKPFWILPPFKDNSVLPAASTHH